MKGACTGVAILLVFKSMPENAMNLASHLLYNNRFEIIQNTTTGYVLPIVSMASMAVSCGRSYAREKITRRAYDVDDRPNFVTYHTSGINTSADHIYDIKAMMSIE